MGKKRRKPETTPHDLVSIIGSIKDYTEAMDKVSTEHAKTPITSKVALAMSINQPNASQEFIEKLDTFAPETHEDAQEAIEEADLLFRKRPQSGDILRLRDEGLHNRQNIGP